jgi:hypothetical protein
MIGRLLRVAAFAIAIAALIDPPLTLSGLGRSRVTIVTEAPTLDASRSVRQTLADRLRPEFDVVFGADASADAVVVIGSDYPRTPPAERQRAFTVTMPPTDGESNVRIAAVRPPRDVAKGTLIHLEVDIDASNVNGQMTTLTVRAGADRVDVAHVNHTWTAARERWRAALDVTPLDDPPWRLRVDLSTASGERVLSDNTADALVDAAEPFQVVMYEPRLSWAGTFVRRTIERDPRFDVTTVAYPSRGSRAPSLTDHTRVVVVGGLDRLTSEDAGMLSRFMHDRGGAIVLLPDSRADLQAVSRWLPAPAAAEVLLEQPARLTVDPPLAAIQASELLTFERGPAMRVLASNGSNVPVIVVAPAGAGQIVISGALDAWRFRANDHDAFDRFWQTTFAGLAASVRPAIDIDVTPPIVAPGETAKILVRVRRSALNVVPGADLPISAGLAGESVRLWPGDEPDTFYGSFSAPSAAGAHRVTVKTDRSEGAGSFVVASDARVARPVGPALSLLSAARGGEDVSAGDVRSLAQTIQRHIAAPTVRLDRRPMRSPWWLVPFVACLGGEWWIRRRRGLR